MADQTYTDGVQIEGSEDQVQLEVQGHSTQTQPLQQWQDSAENTRAQVSADGQLQNGDLAMGTPAALVEANNQVTLPSSDIKQGIQSRGKITGQIWDSLAWIVQELALLGSGGVESVQSAVRARLEHNNSGDSTSAELRAGDFESSNQSGSSAQRVGQITGVSGTASNQENAFTQDAVGVEGTVNNATGGDVAEASVLRAKSPTNTGTITKLTGLKIEDMESGTENFAIRTGKGVNQFGDVLQIGYQTSLPGSSPANFVRLYPKNDDQLYLQNQSGNEVQLLTSAIQGHVCEGRLTFESGNPTHKNKSAASVVYFTPFNGNKISLFDGNVWTIRTFNEISLSLASLSANTNFDIFLYEDSGSLFLEAVPWSDNVSPISKSRIEGVLVKEIDTTRLYLGTIRIGQTAGQSANTDQKRFCWNYYNRLSLKLASPYKLHQTHDSNTNGIWQPFNNDTTRHFEFVVGTKEDDIDFSLEGLFWNLGAQNVRVGMSIDNVPFPGTWDADMWIENGNTARIYTSQSMRSEELGYRFCQVLESTVNGNARFVAGRIWGMIKG